MSAQHVIPMICSTHICYTVNVDEQKQRTSWMNKNKEPLEVRIETKMNRNTTSDLPLTSEHREEQHMGTTQ